MFSTIFKHELNYWFKKPAIYIYALIFFCLSIFMAGVSAGLLDFLTVSTGSSSIVNSPTSITGLYYALTVLIFLFLPSIIGISTFRDYKSNMHSILYSYPFSKANYLLAKFFSSSLMVILILIVVGIGFMIGFRLPGTNPELITEFNFYSYFSAYVIYIIPNVLFVGSIVFSIVTFTRNISAGFIAVLAFIFIQGVLGSFLNDSDNSYIIGLLEPFGEYATQFYIKNWTKAEMNELQIPIESLIIFNRLLWLGISGLIFFFTYKKFNFSQTAASFSWRKPKGQRVVKENFGSITKIQLPKVDFNYSFSERLKASWRISKLEYKFIKQSWPFRAILILGLIILFTSSISTGEMFGTSILPTTWQMLLVPAQTFTLFINILTFLYAGMLIHRSRMSNANHLVDSTPMPIWTLLLSKLIALLRMQILLLFVIVLSGVSFQIYNGYYNFEFGHYFFEVFGLSFIHFVIWAMLALFVQTLMKSPYLGLFVLIVVLIGLPFLSAIGIEQSIYKYNQDSGFNYSDMNGYGSSLPKYFAYKIYWLLAGLILLIVTRLFWVRGLPTSFKERIAIAKQRLNKSSSISLMVLTIIFLGIGYNIYHTDNILVKRISSKEREIRTVEWEKKYRKYENAIQPRIIDVKTKVDLFPKTQDFNAEATYIMENKSTEFISEIYLNHNDLPSEFKFSKPNVLTLEDTIHNFDIYTLNSPLKPGQKMTLNIKVHNKENVLLRKRSPVRKNGTFINNGQLFPTLGYPTGLELTDDKVREKYDLPKNELRPHPTDEHALNNTYISKDADWINFEATVSTSEDQIAIAPGTLVREWKENGRKFYTYKMDSKILNFYAYNSGRYEVFKDKWKDIDIEIYHHKGHEYNLESMSAGVKASIAYNSENFSPYQHKVLRIIEFPRTAGSFAQAFPNTIPFSEGMGFIADVDSTDKDGVDYAFAVTAHELAHQWWAHQVIGADVLGATMMSESLSEYVSLQVLKHEHGETKMRKFLKDALDSYLRSRSSERKREKPLMYNDGQGYIRYQKGSLIFYSLSDYIGEKNLNNALKKYVEKVQFQEPPYTTSIEMVDYIREITPDSLQYLIKDMFETITLYKNNVVEVKSTALDNGKFKVDIEFNVSKYRNDEKGNRFYESDSLVYQSETMKKPITSVKLSDYIELGIFGEEGENNDKEETVLYLKKHKITQINNTISIVVDKEPKSVGVDPFNKLIDTDSNDNRKDL